MDPIGGVKWIFFDVGYTLLDETDAWHARFDSLSAVLMRRGKPIRTEAIWWIYNDACIDFAPQQWRAVCASIAGDDGEAQQLMASVEPWRHELEKPYPGAREMLLALSKRYKLGIIANQSLGTRDRLQKHGLLDFISLVVGSAEAGVIKPDPRIYQEALREARCDPQEAAMVGDRLDNDVRPANLLGMKTVHVRQGGSGAQRPRDASDVATVTVETIADVAQAFC